MPLGQNRPINLAGEGLGLREKGPGVKLINGFLKLFVGSKSTGLALSCSSDTASWDYEYKGHCQSIERLKLVFQICLTTKLYFARMKRSAAMRLFALLGNNFSLILAGKVSRVKVHACVCRLHHLSSLLSRTITQPKSM